MGVSASVDEKAEAFIKGSCAVAKKNTEANWQAKGGSLLEEVAYHPRANAGALVVGQKLDLVEKYVRA